MDLDNLDELINEINQKIKDSYEYSLLLGPTRKKKIKDKKYDYVEIIYVTKEIYGILKKLYEELHMYELYLWGLCYPDPSETGGIAVLEKEDDEEDMYYRANIENIYKYKDKYFLSLYYRGFPL